MPCDASGPGGSEGRRGLALTAEGRPVIKDDDLYDQVEITEGMTIHEALEVFFKTQSSVEELSNYSAEGFNAGKTYPIDMHSAPAAAIKEIVLHPKGG